MGLFKKTFIAIIIALIAMGAYVLIKPERDIRTEAATMKDWLRDNPFLFRLPALGWLFVDKMLEDPANGVFLPPGELWPAPEEWYTLVPNWTLQLIFELRKATGNFNQAWDASLALYRVFQSGVGYCVRGIDPNTWPAILADIEELQTRGECKALIKQRIALTCNLLYTNENPELLLDTVRALCDEKCLTGQVCTDQNATDPWSFFRAEIAALAFFRFGEIENCIAGHSHESCLFPLEGSAIHRKRYGSEQAIPYLMAQLARNPDNLGAKWSLNLAHMTLGQYPDQVPAEFLLPAELFRSDYEDLNAFVNVAGALGVDTHSPMGTTIFEDFNGDHLLDIFHVAATYDPNVRLFLNDHKGGFYDATESADLVGITGGANAKHGDFDGDGNIDLFLVRGGWTNVDHPNSLLRNLGNGTWEDVSFSAFPHISLEASHGADWADINNDGLLDLFVSNENNNCEFWVNIGGGRFVDIGAVTGTRYCKLAKTVAFSDYDNDGWADLFISRSGFPNLLWRNNGKPLDPSGDISRGWSFTEVGEFAGVVKPYLSFPFAWFDINQDGWVDLFTTGHILEGPAAIAASYTGEDYFLKKHIDNIWGFGDPRNTKTPHVYLNNRNGTFEDITDRTGRLADMILGMALNFGDIDNDGFEDVYVGTGQIDLRALVPNRLWRNTGEGLFQDVTTVAKVGHLQKGHGCSFGDFDNDGDLDIISNIGGAWKSDTFRNALFLNPGQKWTSFLKVKLRGVRTNLHGVGARITLTVLENGAERKLYRWVSTGGSYGANPYEQHFGLRDATQIVALEVDWPVTGRQVISALPQMNTFVLVEESNPNVTVLDLPVIYHDVERLLQLDEAADHHCECFRS